VIGSIHPMTHPPASPTESPRHRVVIIGAGFAVTGFKNRFSTLAGWTIAFLGRGRPQRTITEQEALARVWAIQQASAGGQPANDAPDATARAA